MAVGLSAGVVARELSKDFGSTRVLRGLDLDVAPGEVVALLGPNGAGKTTTLGILTTLLVADGGEATVGGFDVATQAEDVRSVIAVTGQASAVDAMLTGAENLRMIGRLRGLSRAEASRATAEALTESGLVEAADRRVSGYSGGMRRKLDLALGLIAPTRVLFLDEPTTGLDTRARAWLWGRVRAAAVEGAAVLVTTQYLEEADHLADRVVILHSGVAVANDTPAALKASVASPRLELARHDGVTSRHTDGTVGSVRALLEGEPDSVAVTVRRPTLDDVFLDLTEEVKA
jgi:ABC-2 type transport system ATP-binding protein